MVSNALRRPGLRWMREAFGLMNKVEKWFRVLKSIDKTLEQQLLP